jgi:hypothetical protein
VAETLGVFNNTPAARSPAAASWKLLYTAGVERVTFSVHVNNASGGDSGFRMALMPASVAYVDGGVPPSYSLIYGSASASKFIENLSELDTPALILAPGFFLAVYCDHVGVTFLPTGISFS